MLTIEQLPFPAIGKVGVEAYILLEELLLDQWIVPEGTTIKLKQTQNFGYAFLPKNTQDVRGFTIPERIFKY